MSVNPEIFKGHIKKALNYSCSNGHKFIMIVDCESAVDESFECPIDDCEFDTYIEPLETSAK